MAAGRRDTLRNTEQAGAGSAVNDATRLGQVLQAAANHNFLNGLHAGCDVCAGVCLLGVSIVLAFLPPRPAIPAPSVSPALAS